MKFCLDLLKNHYFKGFHLKFLSHGFILKPLALFLLKKTILTCFSEESIRYLDYRLWIKMS